MPVPLQQHGVSNTPAKPVPQTATAKPAAKNGAAKDVTSKTSASVSLDRVIQSANSGNPAALTILGLRALDGTNGAVINMTDAVKFLTAAAEKDQAVAQYRLGTLYERGQGVTADAAKAMHWYEMAANQGNIDAEYNLALLYADGHGVSPDLQQARQWMQKAADAGDPEAKKWLGSHGG